MQRISIIIALIGVGLLSSSMARAAEGQLSSAVQLRAGPGDEYPAIKRLARGLSVDIHGCLRTWDWCDVSWRGARGWVAADALAAERQDLRIPVAEYGPALGVPAISFRLSAYWDANYNSAPWYAERDVWSRHSAAYIP
jgi:uncharacterized protein YraI